ncbi:MAG: hypothetical protein F4213_12235 [Boseongicola sp. SB0677_bin_26]|nr:hypothetical protein [Boseongicola sp. SB0665_bin_10]MYG26772.1 hypothetical protein [Boseongicola sp. SB0677_bin_26]
MTTAKAYLADLSSMIAAQHFLRDTEGNAVCLSANQLGRSHFVHDPGAPHLAPLGIRLELLATAPLHLVDQEAEELVRLKASFLSCTFFRPRSLPKVQKHLKITQNQATLPFVGR